MATTPSQGLPSTSADLGGGVHDRPTELGKADAFSHRDYAIAAAEVLAAADRTFTLGLFGDWGIGKTTIVQRIGQLVRPRGLAFVEFDVWRFEGVSLRRQFLREVAQQLKKDGHLPRTYRPDRELRDLEVDVPVISDRLRFSWRALIRAVLIGIFIGGLFWLYLRSPFPERMFGRDAETSTAQEASLLVGLIAFVYGVLSQMVLVEQHAVTARRIEEPDRFYRKFVELLVEARPPRVVIAIDNLDRCSPGLVDKMLATIKTYLEPAQEESRRSSLSWLRSLWSRPRKTEPTDAVFVIAADDAAVRRHMVAREIESLPPTASNNAEDRRKLVDEAERRVDEYLRKFFDASIRLRPILDEDIRRYARNELTRLIRFARANLPSDVDPREALSDQVQDRLVSLVMSALRKNPRRIKQFANSLETRLRMIKAREASGGISEGEKISADLLGIAKLTILEEEWPRFYQDLEENPRRLAEVHREVGRGDVFDNPRLSTFLRDTRDIIPKNVGAVVNLKLASDELELEGFAAFRDAVVYGEFEAAAGVIADAEASEQSEYAKRLPHIFDRELHRGAIAEARNTLDAALRDPMLGLDDDESIRKMLSDAVAQPALLLQLPLLDARRVFAAMALLDDDERGHARTPFIELGQVGEQLGAPGVEAVAVELGDIVEELTSQERQRLRQSFDVEPAASQYRPSYLPLFRADPSLISDTGMQSAWQQLSQRFNPDATEFELMLLGFSAGRGTELNADFLTQLTVFFTDAVPQPERHRAAMEAVLITLDRIREPDEDELENLLGTIQANFQALVSSDPPQAATFGLQAADRVERRADAGIDLTSAAEALLTTAVDQAPFQVADNLTNGIELHDDTRDVVVIRLESALANYSGGGERLRLLRAILISKDGDTRVTNFLRGLITETTIDELVPLLASLASKIQRHLEGIFDEAFDLAQRSPSHADQAIEAIAAAVRVGVLSGLSYLATRWESLEDTQRSIVRKALVGLLGQKPDAAEEIARLISRVQLRFSDRAPLVKALLRASKKGTDTTDRAAAFAGAKTLASSSKPLRGLVSKELTSMRNSSDPLDQATLGLLE